MTKYYLVADELPALCKRDLETLLEDLVPTLISDPGNIQAALSRAWPVLLASAARDTQPMLDAITSKYAATRVMDDKRCLCLGCGAILIPGENAVHEEGCAWIIKEAAIKEIRGQ